MIALPDWIDREAWEGFCEMRQAMKKIPFTDRAQKMVLKSLYELRAAGHDPNASLDQSTLMGWRDVFPPRNKEIPVIRSQVDETSRYLAEQEKHRQASKNSAARTAALQALKVVRNG
jgi:hypothetical protein